MTRLFGKAHHLILDAGAVAGADAFDGAAVQRAAADILPDDGVGLPVSVADVAGQLVLQHGGIGGEGGRNRRLVPLLLFQFLVIYAVAVHPGGGTGLEAAQRNAKLPQTFTEMGGGVHPVRAGFFAVFPDEHLALEKGSGGDDHRSDRVPSAHGGGDGGDVARPVGFDGDDLRLTHRQARLIFQRGLHIHMVALAVALQAQAVDRGAFAQVEHPALQHGGVGGLCHFAAQGIQLPHQVTLGGAPDAGVAGHIADGIQRDGKDDGAAAKTRGGQRRFDAGVSGADDGDIVFSCGVGFHHGSPFYLVV